MKVKVFSDTQKISKFYLLFTLFENPLKDELQKKKSKPGKRKTWNIGNGDGTESKESSR